MPVTDLHGRDHDHGLARLDSLGDPTDLRARRLAAWLLRSVVLTTAVTMTVLYFLRS
jgi:hypothetical protein